PPTSFRWPSPSLRYVAPSSAKASIGADWRRSSIALDGWREKIGFQLELSSCIGQLRHRAVEETLSGSRLPQEVVPIEVRRLPATEPLGIEHGAVARIVVAHPGQGFSEPLL